jgi:branched-chain amino acid transport system ATP-binding protein
MKAFRGKPSIYEEGHSGSRRAELEVKGLSLRFGGVVALGNIDLSLRTGELLAVIGPNGAGKTSLLNCITGFYRPQEGSIHFNGTDITHRPAHELVRIGIGRTFQNIELFPGMTVLSNLFLARHTHCNYGFGSACLFLPSVRREEIRHRRILEEIIDFLEIQSLRNKPVGSLPYGMMKRVELGRALALEPALLVLDEPFAGMNLEEKEDIARFIIDIFEGQGETYPNTPVLREGVNCIVLVEHDMGVVMDIADRIVVLDFGKKIAEGTPNEIKTNPRVISAYLGREK